MSMRTSKLLVAAVLVAVVAAGAVYLFSGNGGYQLKVLMPSAGQTFKGAAVVIGGEEVGEVTDLGVEDDQALVTVEVDEDAAPLREGTTARITWESVIGAQVVELIPGPAKNVALPSGKRIVSKIESVQVDDLLAALDEPTRKRLQGLVTELNQTLRGREEAVRSTLDTAGPAVHALGEMLRAVGEDGPAIRQLIGELRAMSRELAARDDKLATSVTDIGQLTSATAAQERNLSQTLAELPETVRTANGTLRKVPGAVAELNPLLADLRPAVSRLPETARNLSPVLSGLRTSTRLLKPTLRSAAALLDYTPDLLDSTHGALPGTTQAIDRLRPAVAYLRPYTPEAAGWASNWVSVFGSEASNGRNIARALITGSGTSVTDNPGLMPPGVKHDPRPAPGAIAGQPWVDANGDGVR
jgi:phospholipid/cholesterol/gamma-HCH transport system substrate-binding protein